MSIIAIIPARSGSKSVPDKNMKEFCGKPLLYWTIRAAKSLGVDDIVVSTDSQSTLEYSVSNGCRRTSLRGPSISDDKSPVEHAIYYSMRSYLENAPWEDPDDVDVLLMMPTSPLRSLNDVKLLINRYCSAKQIITSLTAVEVATANQNPAWLCTESEKGDIVNSFVQQISQWKTRRQDLPTYYRRNDYAYVFKYKNLVSSCGQSFYGSKPSLHECKDVRFDVDINSEEEFLVAEFLFRMYLMKQYSDEKL